MISTKRLTILVLGLLTLVLGVVALYVVFASSDLFSSDTDTNTNTDVGVSGFGVTATRDLYEALYIEFQDYRCDEYFPQRIKDTFTANSLFGAYVGTTDLLEEFGAGEYLAKSCMYQFQNASIDLLINTYTFDYDIDESRADLYERLNSGFTSLLENSSLSSTEYFYGSTSDKCSLHLFHTSNDFEYMRVIYNINSASCSSIEAENTANIGLLTNLINRIVMQVTDELR